MYLVLPIPEDCERYPTFVEEMEKTVGSIGIPHYEYEDGDDYVFLLGEWEYNLEWLKRLREVE